MDRNRPGLVAGSKHIWSLSARRAWIEIDPVTDKAWALESLSARRAWIEIATPVVTSTAGVSLSARRAWIEI